MRVRVTRWDPAGTIHDDLVRDLADVGQLSEEQKKLAYEHAAQFFSGQGLDLHADRPHQYRGEEVLKGHLFDYFRVEAIPTVLAFWALLATTAAALSALVVALGGC